MARIALVIGTLSDTGTRLRQINGRQRRLALGQCRFQFPLARGQFRQPASAFSEGEPRLTQRQQLGRALQVRKSPLDPTSPVAFWGLGLLRSSWTS